MHAHMDLLASSPTFRQWQVCSNHLAINSVLEGTVPFLELAGVIETYSELLNSQLACGDTKEAIMTVSTSDHRLSRYVWLERAGIAYRKSASPAAQEWAITKHGMDTAARVLEVHSPVSPLEPHLQRPLADMTIVDLLHLLTGVGWCLQEWCGPGSVPDAIRVGQPLHKTIWIRKATPGRPSSVIRPYLSVLAHWEKGLLGADEVQHFQSAAYYNALIAGKTPPTRARAAAEQQQDEDGDEIGVPLHEIQDHGVEKTAKPRKARKSAKQSLDQKAKTFSWGSVKFTHVKGHGKVNPAWQATCPDSAGKHQSALQRKTGCKLRRSFACEATEQQAIRFLKYWAACHCNYDSRLQHRAFKPRPKEIPTDSDLERLRPQGVSSSGAAASSSSAPQPKPVKRVASGEELSSDSSSSSSSSTDSSSS